MPAVGTPSPQKVRAVLIKAGFTPSRTWRTRVPGWHNWSEGFKVTQHRDGLHVRYTENSSRREHDRDKANSQMEAYVKALEAFSPRLVRDDHVIVPQVEPAAVTAHPKGKTLVEVFASEEAESGEAAEPVIPRKDVLPDQWQFKPFMNDCGTACTPDGCPGHKSPTVVDTLIAGPLKLTLNTDEFSSTAEWRAAETLTEVLRFLKDEYSRNAYFRNRLLRRLYG